MSDPIVSPDLYQLADVWHNTIYNYKTNAVAYFFSYPLFHSRPRVQDPRLPVELDPDPTFTSHDVLYMHREDDLLYEAKPCSLIFIPR